MTLDMCCAVLLLFHMLSIIFVCITKTHLHNVPVGAIIFDLAFHFFLQFIFHQFKVKVINWKFHLASEEEKAEVFYLSLPPVVGVQCWKQWNALMPPSGQVFQRKRWRSWWTHKLSCLKSTPVLQTCTRGSWPAYSSRAQRYQSSFKDIIITDVLSVFAWLTLIWTRAIRSWHR